MLLKIFLLTFAFSQVFGTFVDPIRTAALIEVAPQSASVSPCNNFSREFEPNPRGCSWFWVCRNNASDLLPEPIEGICPDDLHFNVQNQTCTYDEGFCSFDDERFNEIPTRCPSWQMEFLPHAFNCDEYYLCWQGNQTLLTCPPGLHFSFFQNGCVESALADCRTEHNYCRRMKDENLIAKQSPYGCETYHMCHECNNRFKVVTLQCHNGTHQFNQEYQHCDVATTCSITPPLEIPAEILPPEPHSIPCPQNIDHDFVRHPNDCFYYFNCASANGRSRLNKCPGNTYFNVEHNVCWENPNNLTCNELYPAPV